ncbi:hypothetical protein F4825DRAFT_472811 [Nemania diffusa]|nr:hypothetical protein F4825DRAFT_472811 [Nemania diffusa]
MFISWLTNPPNMSASQYTTGHAGDKASSSCFRTASSDVWAIAKLLNHLGIYVQTLSNGDFLDDRATVFLDPTMIVHQGANLHTKRRGVRINLTNMEEAISLWPGSLADNSSRRDLFRKGTEAANGLDFVAGECLSGTDFSRGIYQATIAVLYKQSYQQVPDEISDLCKTYLLGSSSDTVRDLVRSWGLSPSVRGSILRNLCSYNAINNAQSGIPSNVLEDFQIFILGYYYSAMRSLLDTSRMIMPEAFGAWTWNEMEFCELVRQVQRDKICDGIAEDRKPSVKFYKKHEFLRIISYLFAGGEMHQIRNIGQSSCGVISKLALLDSTLLGDTDLPDKICRFCLIDVDASCFPTNALGIMCSATQPAIAQKSVLPTMTEDIVTADRMCQRQDFTSIVEPDWKVDNQSSLVTFRYNGRIISRYLHANGERLPMSLFDLFPAR